MLKDVRNFKSLKGNMQEKIWLAEFLHYLESCSDDFSSLIGRGKA